jgi:hypothetical protein
MALRVPSSCRRVRIDAEPADVGDGYAGARADRLQPAPTGSRPASTTCSHRRGLARRGRRPRPPARGAARVRAPRRTRDSAAAAARYGRSAAAAGRRDARFQSGISAQPQAPQHALSRATSGPRAAPVPQVVVAHRGSLLARPEHLI